MESNRFKTIKECSCEGREKQTVVSDLDGTLLRSNSAFPYYMLVAFEASGVLRFALILLCSPLAWLLYHFISEAAAIKLLIFLSCAGVKERDIASVARAVLPKFYIADVQPNTWRVFSAFGKRCLLTANPRLFVEPFAKDFLGVDLVIGSELEFTRSGHATGFVKAPGVIVGDNKEAAIRKHFADEAPDVGLGDRASDFPFLAMCKEGFVVPRHPKVEALHPSKLSKQIVFHDGRLVRSPTPGWALVTLLWLPIGFLLALVRVAAGALLPMRIVYYAFRCLGVRVVVKGNPPLDMGTRKHGVLFVCTHRTLLDPIFVSCAVRRPVSAVTYSLSRVSEIISPVKTVRLSRDREKDASNIRKLLQEGDLVICPEGTTCREPFLLRFSALFAELADHIVPVAMNTRMGMFHATTARGWKGMDCFYFFMNPRPLYELTFLDELPHELTCATGKTSFEVANYIQRVLAGTLNFECTSFTRKDKYKALAGTDGSVSSHLPPSKVTGC
ncbi:hypothetical protein GOP47_0021503 [Adiantum capillus-veneris]|uniref:Phospholipid/glycerol acyltransferase domain-containing protein n=1 Tax=Adiantum capillus-veneris TaxID=13818 RepID=A0A9D4U9R3_ADICA|nr:hypothetical protein GOP47_0021503 [Adiantum capillus-veneris]